MRIAAALIAASVMGHAAHATPRPTVRTQCATSNASTISQPQLLGTSAVPIRAGRFAGSWAQARQDASASPLLGRLIAPARSLCPAQQLAYVQAAVQRQIRWQSDTTQWGHHDYWASAAQTLASGAGDEEDVAIVKMQALRALGFNRSDLFITLGRDSVGGPLVVLVARIGTEYFVLDHSGGAPWQADKRRSEFEPSISFGWETAWVHTRPAGAASVASALAAARR